MVDIHQKKNEISLIRRDDLPLNQPGAEIRFIDDIPIFIYDKEPLFLFSKEKLMEILKKENEIRLSEEVQDRYTNMRYNWSDKNEEYDGFVIDRSCQIQALKEFGYDPSKDNSLEAYQVSCGNLMDDPEVKECVVWMKYNKMRFGSLKVGIQVPDVNLCTLLGNDVSLTSFIHQDRPLVIIGGSYS